MQKMKLVEIIKQNIQLPQMISMCKKSEKQMTLIGCLKYLVQDSNSFTSLFHKINMKILLEILPSISNLTGWMASRTVECELLD